MMMPANFSAISENEMTYVNGGATLAEILAPTLKVENWQKFNTNMVTLIGNKFVQSYVNNTLGELFSGVYVPGDLGRAAFGTVKGAYKTGSESLDDGISANPGVSSFLAGANGVLNAGLRMVGSAAAIYNLATGTVKNVVSGDNFGF